MAESAPQKHRTVAEIRAARQKAAEPAPEVEEAPEVEPAPVAEEAPQVEEAPVPGPQAEPTPQAAAVLTSLDPSTVPMNSGDYTLRVLGTGFDAGSVIVFNGGDEPTTFVSDTEVTTGLQSGTASGPWTIPVNVRSSTGELSNALDFSFTEEVPAPETPEGLQAWIMAAGIPN